MCKHLFRNFHLFSTCKKLGFSTSPVGGGDKPPKKAKGQGHQHTNQVPPWASATFASAFHQERPRAKIYGRNVAVWPFETALKNEHLRVTQELLTVVIFDLEGPSFLVVWPCPPMVYPLVN
jgi:hypothetical protein